MSNESFELSMSQVEEAFERMFNKATNHGLSVGINTTFEHRNNIAVELTKSVVNLEAAKIAASQYVVEHCGNLRGVEDRDLRAEHVHSGYQPQHTGVPSREPPKKP